MTDFNAVIPTPRLTSDIYAQIRETARRFAEDRVRPRAVELDETEEIDGGTVLPGFRIKISEFLGE